MFISFQLRHVCLCKGVLSDGLALPPLRLLERLWWWGFLPWRERLVTFTLKTFVDEFTTEEVKITAEEGKTILEAAQDNGASINCCVSWVV